MEDANFFRNKYRVKSQLNSFWGKYRVLILFLFLTLIVGFVTGIFTATKYAGDLELTNVPDNNLVSFLQGDKGSFGVFFSYFINTAIACVLIICLNINRLFAIVNFVYIFVRGYSFGFTIFAIISLFSFAGVINVVLIIIPFDLVVNFLIIVLSSIAIYKNNIIKKYGKECYCRQNGTTPIVCICILIVLILFLKCMCMPLIRITIIVN